MTPTTPSPIALTTAANVGQLVRHTGQHIATSPPGARLLIMGVLVDAMLEAGMTPGDVIELLNCAADDVA